MGIVDGLGDVDLDVIELGDFLHIVSALFTAVYYRAILGRRTPVGVSPAAASLSACDLALVLAGYGRGMGGRHTGRAVGCAMLLLLAQ